jgi:hypothetical protein
MKKIQTINLFFADNFNRYIDNVIIRDLVDSYLQFLSSKSDIILHEDVKLKLIDVKLESAIDINIQQDKSLNQDNNTDILDNLEYTEMNLDEEDFNNYSIYEIIKNNIVNIENEDIDLTTDKSQTYINKVLNDYFGNTDKINNDVNVVYHDESSSDSEEFWDDNVSDIGSVVSKTTSMCSFFNINDYLNVNNSEDIDIETFERYSNTILSEEHKLIILEFIYEKIRNSTHSNVIKIIFDEFKFICNLTKITEDIKLKLDEFTEFINKSSSISKYNTYSKHFVKNIIKLTYDLTKDYAIAYKLYNYTIIKDKLNESIIEHVGITPFLPLGDSINKINYNIVIDNDDFKLFNVSEFNNYYPGTYCDTCIKINTIKIKCNHRRKPIKCIKKVKIYDPSKIEGTFFPDGSPVLLSVTDKYRLIDYYLTFFKERYSYLLGKQSIDNLYDKYITKLDERNKNDLKLIITKKLYYIITKNTDIKEYKLIYDIINEDYKKYWMNLIKITEQ